MSGVHDAVRSEAHRALWEARVRPKVAAVGFVDQKGDTEGVAYLGEVRDDSGDAKVRRGHDYGTLDTEARGQGALEGLAKGLRLHRMGDAVAGIGLRGQPPRPAACSG